MGLRSQTVIAILSAVYSIVQYIQVYGTFTDLLGLHGRISRYFSCSDGSGAMLLGKFILQVDKLCAL